MQSTDIQSTLNEKRGFPPSSVFSEESRIPSVAEYERRYEEADRDPEKFWGDIAQQLDWFKPWTKVLDWSDAPFAKWFGCGKIMRRLLRELAAGGKVRGDTTTLEDLGVLTKLRADEG